MFIFFFNDTATTEIYTLSLHDALPIFRLERAVPAVARSRPRPRAARRSATGRVLQERRVLRHVRAEVLRSEEHTSELQSRPHLVCRLLLAKKNLEAPHDAISLKCRKVM